MNFLQRFFDTTGFPPRWNCGSGWADRPWLGWLHIVSDLAIWGAYFAIPCILVYFVWRRKSVMFQRVFILFGAFILCCGVTHLMEAIIFWWPVYPLAALIKLATAIVSWATIVALIKVVPTALAMRGPDELEREITARNEAERGLRAVNEQLDVRVNERTEQMAQTLRELKEVKAALDEHNIVAITDCRGIITYVNEKFCATSKYSRDELIGQDHRIINSGFHPKEFFATLWQTINSGKVWKGEIKNRAKDGSFYWLDTTIVPYIGDDGKPDQFIAIRADITARKQAESERQLLLNREHEARLGAENANRAKDEFLATVSHELRTPLTPILGWTRLLREGKLDAAERIKALEVIERNVNMQAHLIEDLLDVSRIITGKLRLDRRLIELVPVLESGIETVRPSATVKNIAIEHDWAGGAFQVNADQARLLQVLWNLLANAVKFTPPGGRINVTLTHQGPDVLIVIADTGEGISPDFLPHIFKRFQQAEMNSTRTHSGLGLGLAIVRHLTEMHGGTVTVSSPGKGSGSTFTLRLPLAGMAASKGDSAVFTQLKQALSRDALSAVRVLIVDDEKDTREFVGFSLRQAGAEVTLAAGVDDALAALQHGAFDVLVSDIGMPVRDGFDLIKTVRSYSLDKGAGIPAIALTAFARDDDRLRVISAGFQKHMPKPVEHAELIEAISDLLPQTKNARES